MFRSILIYQKEKVEIKVRIIVTGYEVMNVASYVTNIIFNRTIGSYISFDIATPL